MVKKRDGEEREEKIEVESWRGRKEGRKGAVIFFQVSILRPRLGTSFQRNSVDRTSSLARVFLTPRSVPLTGKLPLRVGTF